MLKIRQSRDRLNFNMGIPRLVRRHLYIETAPWCSVTHLVLKPEWLLQYHCCSFPASRRHQGIGSHGTDWVQCVYAGLPREWISRTCNISVWSNDRKCKNMFIVSWHRFSTRVNSLWPSDAIWRHWSGSTMAQVMACCLTAPSHYLNQCWLIIRAVQ